MLLRRLDDYHIVIGMWASIILHIVWLAIQLHGTTAAHPAMDAPKLIIIKWRVKNREDVRPLAPNGQLAHIEQAFCRHSNLST
jgi:hypothetical protein